MHVFGPWEDFNRWQFSKWLGYPIIVLVEVAIEVGKPQKPLRLLAGVATGQSAAALIFSGSIFPCPPVKMFGEKLNGRERGIHISLP